MYAEGVRQMKKLQKVLEKLTFEIQTDFPYEYLNEMWNDPSLSDEGNDED